MLRVLGAAAVGAAAISGVLLLGKGDSAGATLRVVSQTQSTITFDYDAPAGADGYVYYADGRRVANTWDGTDTRVTFKKASSYRVDSVDLSVVGTYPPEAPPPPTTTVVTTAPTTTTAPTPTPPPTTTAPSGSPQPTGPTGNFALKFADEFSGTSVDLSKWRPNWLASTDTAVTKPVNSLEDQCSDPRNATVSGGTLKMLLEHRSCTDNKGVTYPNAGVTMQTDSKNFHFTFGVIEARMWTPPGSGLAYNWAQWWATGQDWPQTGEIDVVETLTGGQPCWHFHYSGGAPGGCVNIGSGWHTYTARWQSSRIDWWYDGQPVGTVTSGVTSAPLYLVLGYGHNRNNPLNAPATAEVDYVRVWQ